MRTSVQRIWAVDDTGEPVNEDRGIFFGTFESHSLDNGFEFASPFKANGSVAVKSQNGPIRDIFQESRLPSIEAPNISFETGSGPIWIRKIYAEDLLTISTGAGGINVTDEARARVIEVRNKARGYVGGTYRAEHLTLASQLGDIVATAWLTKQDDNYTIALPGDKSIKKSWSHERTVSVRNEASTSSTILRYPGQDRGISVRSTVETNVGRTIVEHASNFEGPWSAETEAGQLTIRGPNAGDERSREDTKAEMVKHFIMYKQAHGPLAHFARGRTWFDDWESSKNAGSSRVRCKGGDVTIGFSG